VLITKLYLTPPPPRLVGRARLIEQLHQGLLAGHRLFLICAPAGFGKTTLVSTWIYAANEDRSTHSIPSSQVAWLSLDESDGDLARFLTYLIHALQSIQPHIGTEILNALPPAAPLSIEPLLTALLNEIAALSEPLMRPAGQPEPHFLLVLDDYHTIESTAIDAALTFLIEHLPPHMHLVITTREDPPFPLPRLRARQQMTELRAADLRFTAPEASEFLHQVMELDLSADEVAALESRTEGWIAGLQLAALSVRGHRDISGFVQAFAGDNRYIMDYLIEEVLRRQSETDRNFLLHTSILAQLNGPLCNAVTGQSGGSVKLETLQRGNFFLIPLDDRQHWYRYHHLFADVLRIHLMTEQPEQVPSLHRRASRWYEQNGMAADAIHHAFAARDFERAADLIEMVAPTMHQNRQEATVLGWMQALPEDLFPARPVLSILYVGALMSNGRIEGVESRLQDAERWLRRTEEIQELHQGEMAVANQDEFRRLPGSIAMYRAGLALALGNLNKAMTYAREVFDLAPQDDHRARGAAAALLGLAFWTGGELETAHQLFAEGMAQLQMAGNISDAVGGVIALADIRITQGRLHDAMHTYEKTLQLARENGTPALRGTADMFVGLSELARERNDLQGAQELLQRSRDQGEHTGFPRYPYRWRIALARIREAQGDLAGALVMLEEAEPLYVSDFFPNVSPVAARKVRVWITQGKLDGGLNWIHQRGLSTNDEMSYLREFEHITLARVLLAQSRHDPSEGNTEEALAFLARLLQAAEAGGRMGSAIEIMVLQALAYSARGDLPAALSALERALKLAEPEDYIRIFLDEGADMAGLLREAAVRKIAPDYTDRLLKAFEDQSRATQDSSYELASQPLLEPLSQRELHVLRLLKTELSGPEIARELMVGLSTVRTHTKSIYSKLGVNSRRAAVRRAEELGLS
jgi:LuxR family maltose regulon positive regulatory protein